jgi:mannose-6-phosphate isomerase-like protein (cupin superfamily)
MQIFAEAGAYQPPPSGEPNDWIVHLSTSDLSLGTYSIPAGGVDDQTPHTEDEIYVVKTGRATLVTTSGTAPVGPGSVIYVPAGEEHRFTDVTEDLALIVVFAPPYGSRSLPGSVYRGSVYRGSVYRGSVYRGWATPAASSMPRRASASARSLPRSPA